jgi:hypothetical protein
VASYKGLKISSASSKKKTTQQPGSLLKFGLSLDQTYVEPKAMKSSSYTSREGRQEDGDPSHETINDIVQSLQ